MSTPGTSSRSVHSLKDHLVSSFSSLPSLHPLHLTVLSSTPRRTASLFPHASPIVRVWEREHLIVLSADLPTAAPVSAPEPAGLVQTGTTLPDDSTSGSVERLDPPTAAKSEAAGSGPNGNEAHKGKRVMLSALHAFHYLLPSSTTTSSSGSAPDTTYSHNAPRSTSLIYISKADSSGYSPTAIPYTRHLITSFLSYFLAGPVSTSASSVASSSKPEPARESREVGDRVLVQLFARAQGQYLFANSSQNAGKRALKGLGLCAWWKGVYEAATTEALRSPTSDAQSSPGAKVRLAYLLPGYEADEAASLLGAPRRTLPDGLKWEYKPPFFEPILTDLPAVPSSNDANGVAGGSEPLVQTESLARLIPCLPDDPKTRFLDELVANPEDRFRPVATGAAPSTAAAGEKQEKQSRKERSQADEEAQRRRATEILSRVSSAEFWTRMGFRQEMASGDVTGFFTLVYDRPAATLRAVVSNGTSGSAKQAVSVPESADEHVAPSPSITSPANATLSHSLGDLPHPVYERLHAALINVDFSSLDLATEGTVIWDRSVKAIMTSEVTVEGYDACVGEIRASTTTRGAEGGAGATGPKRKEEVVTMLQPRKKKRA